ncbi:MAG: molybdopterin-synthase adenylyltransferase MoeB [Alphaproteobacteria bacterium]|nr:molybdopterin-synthase adenylyltransferase MoeB [Alphaproteobacteria bacterium]
MTIELTDAQLERYARHVILDEVGEAGQARLLAARVLVVGAGGLGAPVLLYLAAAGVGHLTIVDPDTVDLSNLQRQVIHSTATVGTPKAESAAAAIRRLNPDIEVDARIGRITGADAARTIAGHDLVVDGTDNFAARYLLNDACYFARVPLVSAALLRFEGQISTFKAHEPGESRPCYRCLFRAPPPPDLVTRCEQAGIFGAVAGAVGTLQATEVLKELLGLGDSLAGTLLLYDALATSFRRIRARRDPECPLCGSEPTIRDLSGHP